MVLTGVETAGLVLAILPLLISAAEHYREGLQPLKEWKRYPREIDRFSWDLERQLCLFRNTCEKLLRSILRDDVHESKLRTLLDNPKDPGWKSGQLEERLHVVLRGCYTSYIRCIDEIFRIAEELKTELENAQMKEALSLGSGRFSMERAKGELERIRFTWTRSTRTKLLESLKHENYVLGKLTSGTILLTPLRLATASKHSETLKSVRDCATDLYATLKSSWCKGFEACHIANLRLESRAGAVWHPREAEMIRFQFLFCIEAQTETASPIHWTWQAADVMPWDLTRSLNQDLHVDIAANRYFAGTSSRTTPQPLPQAVQATVLDSYGPNTGKKKVTFAGSSSRIPAGFLTEAPTQSNHIHSLCDTLTRASKGKSLQPDCLGFLSDGTGTPHGLYKAQSAPVQGRTVIVTLSEMLINQTDPSCSANQYSLLLRDRIQVALKLACTVLQLQSSPWLNDRWSSKDILLLHEGKDPNDRAVIEPYLRKVFTSPTDCIEHPSNAYGGTTITGRRPGVLNEALFALGLVLLELAYGKPLKSFQQPEDLGVDGKPNAFTDMVVAQRLEMTVERAAGATYAAVVRRCLHCTFDVDNPDLEDPNFYRAVYTGVVKPLMELLVVWDKGR